MNSRRGFTLVELIVTMALVFTLTYVAAISYSSYLEKLRKFTAKKNLSAILVTAEAYKANSGFYLPNLNKMHVSLKGLMDASYVMGCLKNSSTIGWGSGTVCGKFVNTDGWDPDPDGSPYVYDPTQTPPTTGTRDGQIVKRTGCGTPAGCTPTSTAGDSECWQGMVLYAFHSSQDAAKYPEIKPEQMDPSSKGRFKCSTDNDEVFDGDYAIRKIRGSAVHFPDAAAEAKKFFTIEDSTSEKFCKTLEKKITGGKKCASKKGLALEEPTDANIKAIINKEVTGDSDLEQKHFLSAPNRMTVNAISCMKEESGGCKPNGSEKHEYQIITMDSHRFLREKIKGKL